MRPAGWVAQAAFEPNRDQKVRIQSGKGGANIMTKVFRWAVVAAVVLAPAFGTIARADVANNASATNVQQGDNKANTNQSGTSKSGDAVAGQVAGVVSSGTTSVDATNKSDHVDISTGDARGANDSSAFVGLNSSSDTSVGAADVLNTRPVTNLQEGDNKYDLNQTVTATSGDGVGGEVIGVVTSAGGSASVVAANTSTNVDISTGDARAFNDAAAFVGLNSSTGTSVANPFAADVLNTASATNVQEGDNKLSASQTATSATGDGVGGQVLGVVSAGAASVDATNKSDSVDISTGDGRSANDFAAFVGLNEASDTSVAAADVLNGGNASNVQEGSNKKDLMQNASATSGDSVAGQVAGVVTSAGGSADLVLANTSTNSDTSSGDGRFSNSDASFTGLNVSPGISV